MPKWPKNRNGYTCSLFEVQGVVDPFSLNSPELPLVLMHSFRITRLGFIVMFTCKGLERVIVGDIMRFSSLSSPFDVYFLLVFVSFQTQNKLSEVQLVKFSLFFGYLFLSQSIFLLHDSAINNPNGDVHSLIPKNTYVPGLRSPILVHDKLVTFPTFHFSPDYLHDSLSSDGSLNVIKWEIKLQFAIKNLTVRSSWGIPSCKKSMCWYLAREPNMTVMECLRNKQSS